MDTEGSEQSQAIERALVDADLMRWFDEQHLLRTMVIAEDAEHITEIARPPMVFLSARDHDARAAPNPDTLGYPEKRLSEMTLNDFHVFLLRWATRAIDAGLVRCFVCHEPLRNHDLDVPWDGIFLSEHLVAWLFIHFDCKRGLQREIKGRNPFELSPRPPEVFDVSHD
ncbi:MAG TPA: hypothetical protein VH599_16990 [Ktedonobacterales bacterium]|jgi:hypothetical protein